jgi:hypothetical protein
MSTSGELVSEEECWALLATSSVGRVALSVMALPAILPVQYYLDGRTLAVCLGHHQISERSLHDAIVAFAADAIDPVTRSGWSVQIQGRATTPWQVGVDADCGHPTAGQIVRIEPAKIIGHHVHMCPFIDALLAGHHDRLAAK